MTILDVAFDVWWQGYPLKVGKIAAKKEYMKARTVATAEELLVGRDEYIKHKPDWQPWCHPRTFFSQGRWMDEYEVPTTRDTMAWYAECQTMHGGTCGGQMAHHTRKLIDEGKAHA
jgi:hypothetical protein